MPTAESTPPAGAPAVSVCLLGAEAAGKTCFLAGLGILGQSGPGPADIDVAAADTASAQRLRELTTTFRHGRWPNPSNLTEILHLKIALNGRFGRRRVDLISVDYPGEDFRKAIGTLDRAANQELADRFAAADVLLLLVNPSDRDTPPDAELARMLADHAERTDQSLPEELGRAEKESAQWHERHDAMLNAVFQAGERRDPPDVAVVLTACDGPGDPTTPEAAEELLRTALPGLHARLRRAAASLACFPVSAVGSPPINGRPPVTPKPEGYEALLRWVGTRGLRRTAVRGARRTAAVTAAAVTAAGLLFGGWAWWDAATRDGLLADLRDDSRPVAERLLATPAGNYEEVDAARLALSDDLARELVAAADAAGNRPELEAVWATATDPRIGWTEESADLAAVRSAVVARDLPLLTEAIAAAGDDWETLDAALAAHSGPLVPAGAGAEAGERAAEFRSVREAGAARLPGLVQSAMDDARREIFVVLLSSVADLRERAGAVAAFADRFERRLDPAVVAELRDAASLAEFFCEPRPYRVHLVGSGGFAKSREQGVRVEVGLSADTFESAGSGKWAAYRDETFDVTWRAFDPVTVVLRDRWFDDEDVCRWHGSGVSSIELLDGEVSSNPTFVGSWDRGDAPGAYVAFGSISPSSDAAAFHQRLAAFHKYVSPGSGLSAVRDKDAPAPASASVPGGWGAGGAGRFQWTWQNR